MDLSVELMGIRLDNPLILSSGPLSRNGSMMVQALEAGIAAVVTETILNDVRTNVRPRLVHRDSALQNICLYSELSLEEWEREIAMVKNAGGILVANILAHSPSEMAFIGRQVERFGADAIELDVSSPLGEGLEVLGSDPANLYETVRHLTNSVKIPVMVKMSPTVDNLSNLARAAEKGGARGISAINTIRSILGVDIDAMAPLLPTYGGYSGDAIRPIGLGAVATICQSVDLSVSGIGGISTSRHLLEYILLGAATCQLQTALILGGWGVVRTILSDLESWLEGKGLESLEEIRGQALKKLKAFEEIVLEPLVARLIRECPLPRCERCVVACPYQAIEKPGPDKVMVDAEKCTGCGLCVSVCPENCFRMEWGD